MPGDLRAAHAAPTPDAHGWSRVRAVVGTVLLVVVSAFALVTVVIPLALGAQTYTVLTGSMQPGMPPGTMIAVRETPMDEIRVGDVVTYQIRSGEPAVVTHRVVGTTSSTGGDRLLLTRGDANDADDPPVQREQLRGTVVMAVPFLGYPAALFGGQERGAVIAAVGVVVIGFGIGLFALELFRDLRRKRNTAVLALGLVAAAALAPALDARPATAASGPPESTVSERLLVSDDGVRFVSDGAVALFDDLGALTPGSSSQASLWIRNAGPDAAYAGVRVNVAPADEAVADRALASSIHLVVGTAVVPTGGEWVSEAIPAGGTVRIELGLRMDESAQNDTRRATAVVTPVIRLTQAVSEGPTDDPPIAAPEAPSAGWLPETGLRASPIGPVVVLAAIAVIAGLFVRTQVAKRR